MRTRPKGPPSVAFVRFMAAIVALVGLGCLYWGFQPDAPDGWRRFGVFADVMKSVKLGGTMPLFLLLGGFLLWEAWRMAAGKGRYSRD